ncbi:MAG: N-acetylmuramoyl-L-alanine amidase [Actinomycetota bacterium]|nr:N-acetylmuramoyl-L-alanine amidase [Actinomycetota bacterium]
MATARHVRTSTFSAVAVTWGVAPFVEDVAVQVRTRASGRWSAWTEIEVQANTSPDADTSEEPARAGSDLLFVGPSDGLHVRVDAGAVKPRQMQLVLIEPGVSPADRDATAPTTRTIGGATAFAAEPRPPFVSRAAWGADESLRRCTPSVASTIKGGILHTTATGNDYTADRSAAIMRSMYAYHTQSLGWCDLGYNFVVDKYGTLFEGRYGGVDKAVIGSHTGGFNTYTFGVSMMGHHDLVAPTGAMWTTVEKVFAWKLGLYEIDATGTTTYTSAGGPSTHYPYGTEVTKPVISGHRDYSSKSCPGNYAYPLLPSLRDSVARRMGTPAATALTLTTTPSTITYGAMTTVKGKLTTADGTPLAGKTVRLSVRQRGATTWAPLSTRTTGPDGVFEGTHAARVNLDYLATFVEEAEYAAAKREGRVNVAPAVSAALSRSTVALGSSVRLRGSVTPAHAGQTVRRQKLLDGAWKTVAAAEISSLGTYSFAVKPVFRGTKYFRVVKPADSDHVRGVSATKVLTVR